MMVALKDVSLGKWKVVSMDLLKVGVSVVKKVVWKGEQRDVLRVNAMVA